MVAAQELAPIREHEWRSYMLILGFTEDQQVVAEANYDQYMERFVDTYNAALLDWHALWNAAENARVQISRDIARGEVRSVEVQPISPLYRAAYSVIPATLAALNRLDDTFFDDLESLCDADQQQRMSRVRLARQRTIHRNRHGMHELNTDVVALGRSFATTLDDAQASAIHEYLDEFEPRYVNALRRLTESRLEWRLIWYQGEDLHRLIRAERAEAEQERRPTNEDLIGTLTREQSVFNDRAGRLAVGPYRHVWNLNREALSQLGERLSDLERRQFTDLYWRTGYPHIWPDPASAESLYEIVLSFDDLTDSQRRGLLDLRDLFRSMHERLSRRIVDEEVAMSWVRLRNAPPREPPVGDFRDKFFAAARERERLNQRQIDLIRGVLDEDQQARLPEWDFARHPPLRPWDPADVRMRERLERQEQMRQRRERDR